MAIIVFRIAPALQRNSVLDSAFLINGIDTGRSEKGGDADGIGSVARFSYPPGIAHDEADLHIENRMTAGVRKLAIASGV